MTGFRPEVDPGHLPDVVLSGIRPEIYLMLFPEGFLSGIRPEVDHRYFPEVFLEGIRKELTLQTELDRNSPSRSFLTPLLGGF